MRKRNLILIALVFGLIICATIQPAIAYFTTYVWAKGGHPVSIGDTTTIEEEFSDWEKRVSIKNKAGSEPVFIRAKVIYNPLLEENEKTAFTVSGEGWSDGGDGYWYYGTKAAPTILPGDGDEAARSTSVLHVKIDKIPKNPEQGDTFSVTVIYESTPVRYLANGTPYADWDAVIERVTSTGGNG